MKGKKTQLKSSLTKGTTAEDLLIWIWNLSCETVFSRDWNSSDQVEFTEFRTLSLHNIIWLLSFLIYWFWIRKDQGWVRVGMQRGLMYFVELNHMIMETGKVKPAGSRENEWLVMLWGRGQISFLLKEVFCSSRTYWMRTTYILEGSQLYSKVYK